LIDIIQAFTDIYSGIVIGSENYFLTILLIFFWGDKKKERKGTPLL